LILIHLFPKNWGGRRYYIFLISGDHYLEPEALIWSIFSKYLVKGRYCAPAIAIKFVVKIEMGGDENQVSYFIWP
jgi:hypothetical protein